ncbi:hypothetical protein ACSW9V_09730 [Clostridium perfringens]|uniref:hypothetical protein n=1 Tax=Clostridium perfringens TaxID=1502 RepID=UPI003C6C6601
MLALSDFNSNNNVRCEKDELIECINSLISFYNEKGQGFKIFLPFMEQIYKELEYTKKMH